MTTRTRLANLYYKWRTAIGIVITLAIGALIVAIFAFPQFGVMAIYVLLGFALSFIGLLILVLIGFAVFSVLPEDKRDKEPHGYRDEY